MNTALSIRDQQIDLPSTQAAAAITGAMESLKALRTFIDQEFVEGTDYGKIPGCGDKPTLFLPGAQKATMYFNARPKYAIDRIDLGKGHVEFIITTRLVSRSTKEYIGEGVGSCSTMETKYRYRKAEKVCPSCGVAAIIKGKEEYGGGWICFKKKDGCGQKFRDGDRSIESQPEGQVENENLYDVHNTVLKMSKKRSHVDAAMTLGCLSEFFTQDMEDRQDTYAFVEVREAARNDHGEDFHVDGEVVEEYIPPAGKRPSEKLPYASQEQVNAFNKWLGDYCTKINDRWHGLWAEKLSDGFNVPSNIKDILNAWQAQGHLLKWARDSGRMDASISPEEQQVAKTEKLLAFIFYKTDGDKAAVKAEMSEYAAKQKAMKSDAIYRTHPDLAPDGYLEEQEEHARQLAEDESQDVPEPVVASPPKKLTKKELAEKTLADLKARKLAEEQAEFEEQVAEAVPTTGRDLFVYVKEFDQAHEFGIMKYLGAWAKLNDFSAARMVDWDEREVALAYAEIKRHTRPFIEAKATAIANETFDKVHDRHGEPECPEDRGDAYEAPDAEGGE